MRALVLAKNAMTAKWPVPRKFFFPANRRPQLDSNPKPTRRSSCTVTTRPIGSIIDNSFTLNQITCELRTGTQANRDLYLKTIIVIAVVAFALFYNMSGTRKCQLWDIRKIENFESLMVSMKIFFLVMVLVWRREQSTITAISFLFYLEMKVSQPTTQQQY